uniref:Uncharacterized protein n=1 Tax=Acrobeloides nanus TaxID=290746 RepID=A0A914DVN9_9BILA
MGLYTWFLVLNITANYAYCFLICIWQVIPLPPFYMAYPSGLTRFFGSWMAYFHMELVVFSSLNMVLTLSISLAYRYGQTVLIFVTTHLAGTGSLIYSRVDLTELKNLTLSRFPDPEMKKLFETEVIFGYDPQLNPTVVHFVQNGIFGACVTIPFTIIFNLLQGVVFWHNRVRVTPNGAFGYHQLTFWKTLVSRSAALAVLLIVPYLLLILLLIKQEPDVNHLALGYLVIMGSYFLVDAIFLMMCDSHYTGFFFTKIKQICRLEFKKVLMAEPEHKMPTQHHQAVIMFSKF